MLRDRMPITATVAMAAGKAIRLIGIDDGFQRVWVHRHGGNDRDSP